MWSRKLLMWRSKLLILSRNTILRRITHIRENFYGSGVNFFCPLKFDRNGTLLSETNQLSEGKFRDYLPEF